MPLYEYECKKCKRRMEVLQGFDDAPPKGCPECDGGLERLLSAPAFQFKGSGWYVTDYARKGNGGNGKKESAGKDSSAEKTTSGESEKSEKTASSPAKNTESTGKSESADA